MIKGIDNYLLCKYGVLFAFKIIGIFGGLMHGGRGNSLTCIFLKNLEISDFRWTPEPGPAVAPVSWEIYSVRSISIRRRRGRYRQTRTRGGGVEVGLGVGVGVGVGEGDQVAAVHHLRAPAGNSINIQQNLIF